MPPLRTTTTLRRIRIENDILGKDKMLGAWILRRTPMGWQQTLVTQSPRFPNNPLLTLKFQPQAVAHGRPLWPPSNSLGRDLWFFHLSQTLTLHTSRSENPTRIPGAIDTPFLHGRQTLVNALIDLTPMGRAGGRCPSSDDLRHIAGFRKGGSGSSVIEIMRHAVDAASDGLRLSGA